MAFTLPLSVSRKKRLSFLMQIWREFGGMDSPRPEACKELTTLALYLTAYLGDMELSEALRVGNAKGQIAEAKITDAQGKRRKKAIIKGGASAPISTGFNLYRAKSGCEKAGDMADNRSRSASIGTRRTAYLRKRQSPSPMKPGQSRTLSTIDNTMVPSKEEASLTQRKQYHQRYLTMN